MMPLASTASSQPSPVGQQAPLRDERSLALRRDDHQLARDTMPGGRSPANTCRSSTTAIRQQALIVERQDVSTGWPDVGGELPWEHSSVSPSAMRAKLNLPI